MSTKRCPKCGVEKPRAEFSRNRSQRDGLATACKSCSSASNARYREAQRDALRAYGFGYRERNRDALAEKYRLLAARVLERKTPCTLCGEGFMPAVDFHHLNPSEKSAGVSRMVNYSRVRLDEEMAKCICLCSNCHKKYHAGDPATVAAVDRYKNREAKP